MARVPRSFSVLPNHRVHKVWRGHNKEWNLGTDEQKLKYLEFLNDDIESKRFDCGNVLQALTLLSNHTHEMAHVIEPTLYSNHMRRHHARYGAYFNRENDRSGKVAEDRPHTTLICGEQQEMETVFYIHANPVRAKIVKDARNYRWSTHRLYAFGKREPWMKNVRLPEWYMKLGRTAPLRQRAYRKLFARYLKRGGRSKQNFLNTRFFGPLHWILKNEKKVSAWLRKHRAPP